MNGIMLQSFQWELPEDAQHWKRLHDQAVRFAHMGITSVWLPPAYKGSGGVQDVGYGVYDLYDLGEFDQKGSVPTKYGTRDEYIECIHRLKGCGMQTLGDVVLGHRLGADERERVRVRTVNPDHRMDISSVPEDGEVYTRFIFPGRNGRYSSFVWDHRRFTGVDYNALDDAHHLFLLDGKAWAQDVDDEKDNFDYLMGADVDVTDQEVQDELISWAQWYLKETGLDGFRLDAVKHISASFYQTFLIRLRERTRREVYAVGEYWHWDEGHLRTYLDRIKCKLDLFDVPLHQHFHEISTSGGGWDMRRLWEGTLTADLPLQSVTFVDNHDTQPGQSLESWCDGWFKASAYGLILLHKEGYPCVFWGDLFGIPTRGIGPVTELPALMQLRMRCAYGDEHGYFDDPHLIGFTREGMDAFPDSGLAFLCTNKDGGEKKMYVGQRHAGHVFRCVVGGQAPVKIDSEGFGVFRTDGGRCAAYAPTGTLHGFLFSAFWHARLSLRCRFPYLAPILFPTKLDA
ncbi:MAG: alpha-amylase [Clostridia bacterium]|nr:alpha-amylase [Clostridia bacterium]